MKGRYNIILLLPHLLLHRGVGLKLVIEGLSGVHTSLCIKRLSQHAVVLWADRQAQFTKDGRWMTLSMIHILMVVFQ